MISRQALSTGNNIDEDMTFGLTLGALLDSWDTFVTTHGNDATSNMKNMILKMKKRRDHLTVTSLRVIHSL